MASKSSISDVSASNYSPEPLSDDDLIRGFTLALGAGGRKPRTLFIYEDSIRKLSDFAQNLGLPGLVTMDRKVVRHWLTSLYQQGNKPATVSIRYRSLNRFSGGALRRMKEPITQWTTWNHRQYQVKSSHTIGPTT